MSPAPARGQDGKTWDDSEEEPSGALELCYVAPPPQWKPKRASAAAPRMELLSAHPFSRAPAGARVGAGAGALPNMAFIDGFHDIKYY